jgi:hypothetical protein
MTKKINIPDGKLFSPEYREILKRMKNKPPELEEIADRVTRYADKKKIKKKTR